MSPEIESHAIALVSFPVDDGEQSIVERMFGISQGKDDYLLDSSPFYVFNISYGDSFRATLKDGELIFSEVVSRGGHSTYRVKLPEGCDHEYFLEHWTGLEKLGCTYEGSSANIQRLYSIDIPPGSNVFEVYKLLEKNEQLNIWTFEEGYYFDPAKS